MSDTPTDMPAEDPALPSEDAEAKPGKGKKRPLRRKLGLAALFSMLVLVVLVGLAAFLMIGRPLVAPEWLKSRIETQINNQFQMAQVRLGGVSLIVEDMWLPRVKLDDVEVLGAAGEHVVRLSDVESTLALSPLIKGQVQPAQIWLTGAQLVLRRDESGRVRLSFDQATPAASQAASFVQLIEQVDRALISPAFADLTSFTADGLTIRYEDARAGRAWTVDGGRISLTRIEGYSDAARRFCGSERRSIGGGD
ncbi:AsmA family protein [Rhodobacteraceae bacterium D3-12]|nr:AsmA family protein [Rhodobacteraceae bacterium D3-12]